MKTILCAGLSALGVAMASAPDELMGMWRGMMIQVDADGTIKQLLIDDYGAILAGGEKGTVNATVTSTDTDITFNLETDDGSTVAMECKWAMDGDAEYVTSALIACGGPGHGNVDSISSAMSGHGPIVNYYTKCDDSVADVCQFLPPEGLKPLELTPIDSSSTSVRLGMEVQLGYTEGEYIFEFGDSSVTYVTQDSSDKWTADYEFNDDGTASWTWTDGPDSSYVGKTSTGVWSAVAGMETKTTYVGLGAPGSGVDTMSEAMDGGIVYQIVECSASECDFSALAFYLD